MIADLERRLDDVCKSIENSREEFDKATESCVEVIHGMHQRMERIEKWIEKQEGLLNR